MKSLGQDFQFELLLLAVLEIPIVWALLRVFTFHASSSMVKTPACQLRVAAAGDRSLVLSCSSLLPGPRLLGSAADEQLSLALVIASNQQLGPDRKWRALDMIRLAFWGSIHPFVTVVLLAMGFEGAIERKWSAVIWFLGSAIAAVVGPVRLRAAQGFSWRKVKSGTLYVRALHLARKMGVSVRWVYVIPPGRGILTNAFATLRGVALTDNFGEFLHGPQLDFVIAHELAHNKNKHFRKQFLSLLLVVLSLSVMSWALASLIGPHESVFLLGFLLTILLSYFAISRRFEYEADRDAALLVGSPQPGIRALAALYRKTGTPIEEGLLLELFMSHPSFANRTSALARVFGVPGVPGTTSANTGISDGAPLPQPE